MLPPIDVAERVRRDFPQRINTKERFFAEKFRKRVKQNGKTKKSDERFDWFEVIDVVESERNDARGEKKRIILSVRSDRKGTRRKLVSLQLIISSEGERDDV